MPSFESDRNQFLGGRARRARRLRIAVGIAALALALPALLLPAAAAAQEDSAARKFGRGLAGMTLGVLEVPGNVVQETRTNGVGSGITIGLAVGLGKLVVRELIGVYEFVTAPFPVPAGFKPILEPEYPWEYFESAPGRPYGFRGTYLADEEKVIAKIPGAAVKRWRGALVVQFPSDLVFESSSSELPAGADARLRSLATVLRRHPEAQVAVLGFADQTGPPAYNLELSRARAATVRRYLLHQGVDADRVVANGFGENGPVASNLTSAGRQSNRRVQIELRASGVGAYR